MKRFACALLALTACGGPSLSPAESAVADQGGSVATTAALFGGFTVALVEFGTTIDPSATPDVNAQHVAEHLTAQLGGCGTVDAMGSLIIASFGDAPGCTLTSGLVLTSQVSISVAQSGSATTLTVMLGDLHVGGGPVSGMVTYSTTNGTVLAANVDVGNGTQEILGNLSVASGGAAGSVVVTGDATAMGAAGSDNVHIVGLGYTAGQCYPGAGTATVMAGAVSVTATFSAQTATSGEYTVQRGTRTEAIERTLPAYGSCPSSH